MRAAILVMVMVCIRGTVVQLGTCLQTPHIRTVYTHVVLQTSLFAQPLWCVSLSLIDCMHADGLLCTRAVYTGNIEGLH